MSIVGSIIGVIAVVFGILAACSAKRKVRLITNPWLWMSKEECDKELAKVDIKAEYRQQTIVLAGSALLLGYASATIFRDDLLVFPIWVMVGLILVYAIKSSIKRP